MTQAANAVEDVAARLFTAIEAKQVQAVADLYTDDVEVWHNFSNAVQSKQENLAVLTGLTESVEAITYEVVERQVLGDRLLQRHNLRCRVAGGSEFVIPACIFVTVAGDRISRIDEYLDTGQANRLREATGRQELAG